MKPLSTRNPLERKFSIPPIWIRWVLASILSISIIAPVSAQSVLDWSDPSVVWNPGEMENTFVLDNGVEITITVSSDAAGTFEAFDVTSPYEDGPSPPNPEDFFGTGHDLGILFDPAEDQGLSPVIITAEFSESVTDLAFEISDIDFNMARIDQVVITCDGVAPSSLTPKTMSPSFDIDDMDLMTVTSDGETSVLSGSDDGTLIVECDPTGVTTVVITYNEFSGVNDPNGRGIGLFFMLTEVPVELTSFTID